MRKLLQTVANSDAGLAALVVGLLAVAGVCWFAMRRTSPIPVGEKTVITICRGGMKRDRLETRELKAAFEAAHPDIYLNVIQSNLERKPDTMIAAGVAPDIINVGVDRVDYYLDGDALLDLTPFVERDPDLADLKKAADGGPDAASSEFLPHTVTPFVRTVAGRRCLLAMPVNYTPFIVYYSKDLFDKYRVPYPDENWDWDGLRERAVALTRDRAGRRADHPDFDRNEVVSYGFQFAWWQHGVETFIRQNGGRLVNEEGTQVVADDPRTVAALQFLFDLKYKYGVVPMGQGPAARDIAFAKGTVGMFLWGVFEMATLNEQAAELDWDVAPLPRGPDGRRASIVYTNAWGISKQSRYPEAAFAFLKFLVSREGLTIARQHEVFLPVRRSMITDATLADPTHRPRSVWALTHDMDQGYAQVPFSTRQYYGDVYEIVNEYFDKLLRLPEPKLTPLEAAQTITREGNLLLRRDKAVRRSTSFGALALGLAAVPAALVLWRLLTRPRRGMSKLALREERWGYLLISPWVLGFLVFAAFPIIVSVTLSFAQWQSVSDFTRSEFIGVENYRVALSGEDKKFWLSLWVTFRYALLAVPAGLIAGLTLAILMNQKVRGISVFRTLYYIPAILPSVATAVLWWHLFDKYYGWVNRVLDKLNFGNWLPDFVARLGIQTYPIGWLSDERVTPVIFIVMALWAVGGGMIIYLAGLQNIPTQLYEAAQIDGAGRWGQLRHVTLPMLSPVIFFNLIMGIIGSFQVFNVAFVLFDGGTGPNDSALFYGLHLFREAFFKYRLGYASALAWILFVVILAMTALVLKSSPMWVHYEAARGKRV
jgi:multiple sugar transport system permease protein